MRPELYGSLGPQGIGVHQVTSRRLRVTPSPGSVTLMLDLPAADVVHVQQDLLRAHIYIYTYIYAYEHIFLITVYGPLPSSKGSKASAPVLYVVCNGAVLGLSGFRIRGAYQETKDGFGLGQPVPPKHTSSEGFLISI